MSKTVSQAGVDALWALIKVLLKQPWIVGGRNSQDRRLTWTK